MTEKEKQDIVATLQTLIVAIHDGSIISNAEDYVKMVEGMFNE